MAKNKQIAGFGIVLVLLLAVSVLLVAAIQDQFLNKEAAVKIAEKTVPGVVVEVEEATGDQPYFEVEVLNNGRETEVKIDAKSGEVLAIEEEDANEPDDVPITGSALDRASAAALAHIGQGRVTDTEIGDEEGYYEIEITYNGREVDVHLDKDFNVLSVER